LLLANESLCYCAVSVNRRSALAPDPREGRDLDQPRPGPPAPGGRPSTRP
jgi:hypothetical protein